MLKGGPCESSLGPIESSPQQNLNKDKSNKADWPTNKVWTPETIIYVTFFENYNNGNLIFFLLESVIMHKRWKPTCFFCSLRGWRYCVGARLKFWRRSRVPKKGIGTRRLKYRLPENPGILNSPHTSVRGNGLVEGHTYVNHVRWSFAYISQLREQMANWKRRKWLWFPL